MSSIVLSGLGYERWTPDTPAERRKLSATLTSRGRSACAGAVLALTALLAAPGARPAQAADQAVTFVSPDAALEQGLNAYRGGYIELAIPALRYAADHGEFLAQYLLSVILADNSGAHTNHGEAYGLLRNIVKNYANVDPDDDMRAPYVARALLAFGEYLSRGVPELKVAPNPAMALPYIEHAAKFFGNRDAQFVLAKMLLSGESGRKDPALALHFLSTLVQSGHPSAQAFFADLYWRGNYIDKDETRALALAELAVKGAAPTDYLWIDEIYQNIYCGMNEPRRNEARPLVQRWGQFFGFGKSTSRRAEADNDRMALGFVPMRTCEDGKPVPLLQELRGINPRLPSGETVVADPNDKGPQGGAVRGVGAPGK